MVSPFAAAKAYAAVQNVGIAPPKPAAEPAGAGFSDLVKSAVSQTIQASQTAESRMAAHTAGRADLVDVVTAVASAEASLETVMAVRDQVIAAYQEIMRMPI